MTSILCEPLLRPAFKYLNKNVLKIIFFYSDYHGDSRVAGKGSFVIQYNPVYNLGLLILV